MLLFVVTVKSRKASSDWAGFSQLVNRCLTSLTMQTSPHYQVVAVHDELPEHAVTHPRIHYLRMDGPAASTWGEAEVDRARRLRAGAEYGGRFAPRYIMNVDCDDLVHRELTAHVHQSTGPGWFVDQGYVWRNGSRFGLRLRNGFNQICGTSMVLRHDLLTDAFRDDPLAYEQAVVPDGGLWFDHRLQVVGGEALRPLPFPGAAYCMATGENIRAGDIVKERARAQAGGLRVASRQFRRIRPALVGARFHRRFGL